MSVRVTVELPEAVAGDRSPDTLADEVRTLLVLERFRRGEFGSGRAARLLGIPRVVFLDLAAERGISTLGYGVDELRRELGEIPEAGARG